MNDEISPETAGDYLIAQGLLPEGIIPVVTSLGGGVSNIVLKVQTPDRCLVVKQSLGKLRVPEDWFSDVERIFQEAACMQVLRKVLGPGSVPEVCLSDQQKHLIVISCAPEGSSVWKSELLQGRVNPDIALEAGRLLGLIHSRTALDPAIRERFLDDHLFIQLRIDPYYRTIAQRHDRLKPLILAEIDRMLSHKRCLVHADNSPKNMLVKDGHIFLIDFETAHWGDPSMDLGFFLNHLFLKAIHNPRWRTRYFEAIRAFWHAYLSAPPVEDPDAMETHTIRELGCLMLARVDGKSPAEYLTGEGRTLARQISCRLIEDPPASLEEVIELAEQRLRNRPCL